MPDLFAKMEALNWYAESLKWYNYYFIAHRCIHTSFLADQWKHHTNLPVCFCFFFHFSVYTHSTNIVLLNSKEGLKGNRTLGCPIFSFPSRSSFSASIVGKHRRVAWVRRDVIWFRDCTWFLEHHCLLLSKQVLVGRVSRAFSGSQHACLLRHNHNMLTWDSPWVLRSSHNTSRVP